MPTTPVQSVQIRIYNGTLDPSTVNRTDEFERVTAIYMVSPDSTLEWEVDFYLQFKLDGNTNRLIKLTDNFTLDTVVVYPIPIELQGLGIPMYGVMIGVEAVSLEVWAIQRGNNGEGFGCDLTEIKEQLNVMQLQITELELRDFAQNFAINVAVGNIALGLSIMAGGLAPISAGVTATAIPAFGTSAMALGVGSSGALLP